MVLYSFRVVGTEEVVQQFFPMGECPKEIQLQDGRKAIREYGYGNISYGKGVLPATESSRRRKMMTQKNIDAGKKGTEKWRSKMPKLVSQ